MLIAITGGIGSGKSVVSRVLDAMGYEVYDCDSRARGIIDNSGEILLEIAGRISGDVIDENGVLDRKALASIVFSDSAKLEILNDITHGAVRRDLAEWKNRRRGGNRPVFVETAILYQSGIDRMVDEVWEVTAPIEERVARVMARDGIDREAVCRRIESQKIVVDSPHGNVRVIINDGFTPLLPQIIDCVAHSDT